MTVLLSTLQDAAFWERRICLDCSTQVEEDSQEETCPSCKGELIDAVDFLSAWRKVEEDEE